jgi:hypothetical protein
MDAIGLYLATMHQLLGHDATAAFIGMPTGNKAECVMCKYEANPNDITRQAVKRALAPQTPDS